MSESAYEAGAEDGPRLVRGSAWLCRGRLHLKRETLKRERTACRPSLIKNADWLVTMDAERRIITDGALLIEDDRVVKVGKTSALQGPDEGRHRDRRRRQARLCRD